MISSNLSKKEQHIGYSFGINLGLILCLYFGILNTNKAQIFDHLNVDQCDSLIKANTENPYFVILDVRRPSEYNPEHLVEAINRNYYDTDFLDQLDTLNKEKTYLIHCKSGGRSGNTINHMEDLGFNEVYNMIGGIKAWNADSLPTTTDFAAEIAFLTDSIIPHMEVNIGEVDTIQLTITNSANDTLLFNDLSDLNEEFESDFDIDSVIIGAHDYTFSIFYTPNDEIPDTITYAISSNGGMVSATIFRAGILLVSNEILEEMQDEISVFPNPCNGSFTIAGIKQANSRISIHGLNGRKVFEKDCFSQDCFINLTNLNKGSYIMHLEQENKSISKIIIFN